MLSGSERLIIVIHRKEAAIMKEVYNQRLKKGFVHKTCWSIVFQTGNLTFVPNCLSLSPCQQSLPCARSILVYWRRLCTNQVRSLLSMRCIKCWDKVSNPGQKTVINKRMHALKRASLTRGNKMASSRICVAAISKA